jgi:hypothetical protein
LDAVQAKAPGWVPAFQGHALGDGEPFKTDTWIGQPIILQWHFARVYDTEWQHSIPLEQEAGLVEQARYRDVSAGNPVTMEGDDHDYFEHRESLSTTQVVKFRAF